LDAASDAGQSPASFFTPSAAQQAALASFHGADGAGKDGPLAKIGFDLALLYHQHQLAGGRSSADASRGLLQVVGNKVMVNAIARGDRQALQRSLVNLGMQVVAAEQSIISGLLPIDALDQVAALGQLRFAAPAYRPIHRVGQVDSEGDLAVDGPAARTKFNVNGTGITVGVISDSFNVSGDGNAAQDVMTGDLPIQAIDPLIESFLIGADEGRAMLQIVHDVAPGASLSFAHADTQAQMAQNIRNLAFGNLAGGPIGVSGMPADIIVDDMGFFDEPFFQDGIVAQAIDRVVAGGVAYFSAAGNAGTQSYQSAFRDSGIPAPTPPKTLPDPITGTITVTGSLHDFDPGPAIDTYQKITLPVGTGLTISLQWDEPFGSLGGPGATSDVDLLLVGADQLSVIASQINLNIGADPVEVLTFFNTGAVDVDGVPGSDTTFNIALSLLAGSAPGLIKYIEFDGAMMVEEFDTASSTAFGHPNAVSAAAVASAFWQNTPALGALGVDPPLVNEDSSAGGVPILFNTSGTRLQIPEIRQTVDLTGPDGVTTTLAGFSPFFGTSAAASHVGAVAALVLEAAGGSGSLTPSQIYTVLGNTALDIVERIDPQFPSMILPIPGGQGYDVFSGHGLVIASAAVATVEGTVPPGPGPTPPPSIGPGEIRGVKWHDQNGNGQRDFGEPTLSGWTIFADLNNDGRLTGVEPSAVTDSTGAYRLTDLAPGTYRIVEVPQAGWTTTFPVAAAHRIVVGSRQTVTGINFGNRQVGAVITGTMWNDLDGDSVRDSGEGGVSGLFVFVDLDRNGSPSTKEPSAVSGPGGHYRITGVPEGTHVVFEAYTPGWIRTSGESRLISVVTGEVSEGVNFGHRPEFDYGDAPARYPTLSSKGGPVHGFVPDFFLGSAIDGEADGIPGNDGMGDDSDGISDDDGVIFLTGLQPGETAEIAVFAKQLRVSPGYLQGWLDFNGDGDWQDAGEQIFKNKRLANGTNLLTIDVPANATTRPTAARFRWGFEPNLSYTGRSLGGEVEDYVVTIPMEGNAGAVAMDDSFSVSEDVSNNTLDVLENDMSRFGGPLTITTVSAPSPEGSARIVSGSEIQFTPDRDFFGTVTFDYTIRDQVGGTDRATVTVTVTNVNDAPMAADDEFVVGADTLGNVLDVLANDSSAPDPDEDLLIAGVSGSLAGASLSVSPGGTSIIYTPRPGFSGTDTATYTLRDASGATAQAVITIEVEEFPDLVAFRLETTDMAGLPISTVDEGGSFLVRGYVQDLRTKPLGVFSAYLDVTYDNTSSISVDGPITISNTYGNAQSGNASVAGFVDEVGGVDGLSPLGGVEVLLFSVPFRAARPGSVTFAGNPADVVPLHAVELFGESRSVPPGDQRHTTTTIEVRQSGARDDEFQVPEDSSSNRLDVLANDDLGGAGAVLTITEVGTPDSGGTAAATDGQAIVYTPQPNFFGTETISYRIEDDRGNTGTAVVRVTVTNVNDPPDAVDDAVTVVAGSVDAVLNVLDNDSIVPDSSETLSISQVNPPAQGGSVRIAADQKSLLFTPADGFVGSVPITYQIIDGNGGSDQATVTVQVVGVERQVRFALRTTDVAGNAIDSVRPDQTFLLRVSVEDIRSQPTGVFSAYLDLIYDETLASVAGPIDFNDQTYPSAQFGITAVAGLIDEAGALDGFRPLGGGAFDLLSVPFRATNVGQMRFSGNPADDIPLHDVLFFGGTAGVDPNLIEYGTAVINVVATGFTNSRNALDVNDDGMISPIDALHVINEIDQRGARRITRSLSQASPLYVDVNGDGFVSPIDALLVINWLSEAARAVPRAALSAGANPRDVLDDAKFASDTSSLALVSADSIVIAPGTSGPLSGGSLPTLGALSAAGDPGHAPALVAAYDDGRLGAREAGWPTSPQLIRSGSDLEDTLGAIAEDVSHAWQQDLRPGKLIISTV
jgi:hypothetical protein